MRGGIHPGDDGTGRELHNSKWNGYTHTYLHLICLFVAGGWVSFRVWKMINGAENAFARKEASNKMGNGQLQIQMKRE